MAKKKFSVFSVLRRKNLLSQKFRLGKKSVRAAGKLDPQTLEDFRILAGMSKPGTKVVPKPTRKGTAAAKKAWETRRKNAEENGEEAEAERLEALRVLDELAKNRPPVSETDES